MIKCGKCHERHATVADVRYCHEAAYQVAATYASLPPVATDAEYDNMYAADEIRAERERNRYAVTPSQREALQAQAHSTNREVRDEAVARLRSAHKSSPVLKHTVPAGHYAITNDQETAFYRVDKPTEGRWAGYTFVKRQAGDEYWPVRDRFTREAILKEIAKDPEGAMLRYGKEIGRCGHCNRTLTNEESRARGIGPICAGKMGW